MTQMWI